jgi:hypothetical protein
LANPANKPQEIFMSSETNSSGKRSWTKILGIAAGVVAVLLVVAYMVGTSSWMLKSIILPKASAALHAAITVEDAAIHPFSGISLSGLKVTTQGTDSMLTAKEASVKYPSLLDLIGGKINIDDITISGVQVNIIQNADGTSNLDPFTKSSSPAAAKPAAAGKAPQVRLKHLTLADAGVHFLKTDKAGAKTVADLTGINITLENLGNDQTAKLSMKSGLAFEQAATNKVQASVQGDFSLTLNGQLMPTAIAGALETQIAQATGGFKEVSGVGATLKCDWTPTDIKDISLKLQRGNQGLAAVAVSGPFNLEKVEGKLKGDITAIDRKVLNLVGAAFGIDFNSTTINSSGEIEISQGGKQLALHGAVSAARFSVTQLGQTTPEMDVEAKYDMAVNLPAETATIQTFALSGVQKRQEIIKGTLARPMKIAWGKASGAVDESAFDLSIRGLDLADWRAFAAGTEPAGKLNLQLNLLSQGAGKNLTVDMTASLTNFAARFGSNRVAEADLSLVLKSGVSNFAVADISAFELRASHQKQTAATITGSGRVDSGTMDANLQAGLEVSLPRLAALAGVPGMQFSAGTLSFQGAIVQKNLNPAQTNQPPFDRSVTGQLRLSDLTGVAASNRFDRFAITADCDLQVKNNQANIRKLSAVLSQSGLPGGTLDVSGQYDLARTNGQFNLAIKDLNENTLKSFAAALAPNRLEHASISANLNAICNPAAESSVQGQVRVENLLITDPAGQFPKVPMTAVAKLDGGMQKQKVEIRQFNLAIQQGQADGGVVDAKGRFDLARTNGQFTLNVSNLNQNALRPALARFLGSNSLEAVAINAALSGKFDLAGESSVVGGLSVANLLVKDAKGQWPKQPLALQTKVDASLKNQLAEIRQCTGAINLGTDKVGSFEVSGRFDLAKTNGQFALKIENLTQDALRPLLADALGDKQLKTVVINANTTGKLDLAGESSVNGNVTVANLVINDPSGAIPADPLSIQLFLDGSWLKDTLDLRGLGLQLTPTAQASNRITLSGKVNLANTKAISGTLKLNAEALDITAYYNLFAGGPAGKAKPTPTPAVEVKSNVEPAAVTNLPLASFAMDASIGRFYLRDMAITNLAVSFKAEGAKFTVSNLQAVVNGAPVRGSVLANLGVPGYTYDANLTATRLPLTPVVSSFMPYAKDGLNGFLSASLAVKGAGVTGRSLRQSLTGGLTLDVTNASIIVTKLLDPSRSQPKTVSGKLIKDLTKVLFIVGPIVGIPNLDVEPFQVADLNVQFGGGNIVLKDFGIRSPNIIVQSAGTIPIADVLDNSPMDLPVEIYLSRQLATRFLAPDTSEKATHLKLPTFVHVKGTIAEADVKVNKLALGGAVAETIGSKVGGDAGKILKGIGILGGGNSTAVTNPPTAPNQTPPPATRPTNAVENLLNNFLRPRK